MRIFYLFFFDVLEMHYMNNTEQHKTLEPFYLISNVVYFQCSEMYLLGKCYTQMSLNIIYILLKILWETMVMVRQ